MSKHVGNNKKGFTIIEVVLVLPIAGLIFLIVFLAVPALQRARRDTQRKNDVGRFLAQLEQYASNNNGTYPSSQAQMNAFVTEYMDDFSDPKEGTYDAKYLENQIPDVPEFFYHVNSDCKGTTNPGNRAIAVAVGLEAGGFYCQDNSQPVQSLDPAVFAGGLVALFGVIVGAILLPVYGLVGDSLAL